MAASSPDRVLRQVLLPRAVLVGVTMGVVALVGGTAILRETDGGVAGTTGVVSTLLAALAAGVWAGAPAAHGETVSLRDRWLAAGLATGAAGAFATFWTLVPQVPTGGQWRVLALLVLVAAPIYAFGMLIPALLVWGERWEEGQEESSEGWGSLGFLVVGVLIGLVFGALLGGLALVPSYRPGPLLIAMALTVLFPLVLGDLPEAETEERVLEESWTAFGELRVTEVVFPGERQPERRLYLNGEEESGELVRSGAPTLAYIAAAESWMAKLPAPSGAHYLFLGGGAYTLPRRIAERYPDARITVVELDPEVTRLAYRFFGLRRHHGIVSVHGDARAFLERGPDSRFHRAFLDVYAGQEAFPYPLVTREAFSLLRQRLRPDGVALLNLIGVVRGEESRRLWSVVRTLSEVFPNAALYTHLGPDFAERQNVVLAVAVDVDFAFPDRAGWFEALPRQEWPAWDGTIVFRDLLSTWKPDASVAERQTKTPLGPREGPSGV
jgi:MFS family permease